MRAAQQVPAPNSSTVIPGHNSNPCSTTAKLINNYGVSSILPKGFERWWVQSRSRTKYSSARRQCSSTDLAAMRLRTSIRSTSSAIRDNRAGSRNQPERYDQPANDRQLQMGLAKDLLGRIATRSLLVQRIVVAKDALDYKRRRVNQR